ncbi:hypothetical protein CIHG_08273 [Coccidioides immitis H538.4]|uniref:Uncharacterized protein n=2 Tax=Coccidioides immitis TaxID=5501 RepID=A0A0J8US95_COCIT|nr:hypothetical protein CIRG_02313 [Coccidioides immitis RMSCC 2394]KMU90558.1 hypothetical protein CIHG_08273 [Coccidioides immitis H538.4]
MSYPGYGFSSNSAHPSRQPVSNTQSSSTPSSSWQNADRTYSQKEYGWQEQIPSLQGSNTSHSENPCWSSSNDAQVQSQNYPPQVTSRNSQSGQYTAPHSEQGRPQLQFRKILPAAQTSTTPGPLRHKAELRLPMFIRPISRVDPPRTQPIGQTLRNDLEMLPRVL